MSTPELSAAWRLFITQQVAERNMACVKAALGQPPGSPPIGRQNAPEPDLRVIDRTVTAARGSSPLLHLLMLDGPGADTVYGPMLGPAAATIGCVGVAPHMEGRGIGTALVARASEILRDRGAGTCHIGWTVREHFYTRAGYRPWPRYRMFRTPTSPR